MARKIPRPGAQRWRLAKLPIRHGPDGRRDRPYSSDERAEERTIFAFRACKASGARRALVLALRPRAHPAPPSRAGNSKISEGTLHGRLGSRSAPLHISKVSRKMLGEEEMRLENKVAMVTGAASGFGAEIARVFAREGAKVAVLDINGEGAATVAREIGPAAVAIPADVTKRADIENAVRKTMDAFG